MTLKFYFNGAPNPAKVALFLEEAGLAYEPMPVDTRKGEQHKPEFLELNPNGKVPVIDDNGTVVFDSNAILLYLAEKTGKFLPSDRAAVAVLADVRRLRRRPVFGTGGAFQAFRAEGSRIRQHPLPVRGAAPLRHHRCASAATANTWQAMNTRSSIWRFGVGRGWCRSFSATTRSTSLKTSSACSTRSARGRRRRGPSR